MGTEIPRGILKNDYYYTLDNAQQSLVTYEMPGVELPFGIKGSVALGKDVRANRTPSSNPDIADVFLSRPLFDGVALKGRIRTSYSDNPTTQFRGGLQYTYKINDDNSIYAQVYAADKVKYRDRNDTFSVGAFLGVEHKFSDNFKAYAEVQSYDFKKGDSNVGFNIGFRYTF